MMQYYIYLSHHYRMQVISAGELVEPQVVNLSYLYETITIKHSFPSLKY